MKKEKVCFHGAGRLREERERIGFSQGDAETLFGVSRVTWGKYERGESTPGADVLSGLADKGADVLYIITGTRTVPGFAEDKASYTPAERAADQIRQLKLTSTDAELLMALADRLKNR